MITKKRDYEGMWKILDEIIKGEVRENESMKSGYPADTRNSIVIRYAAISGNVLYTADFKIDVNLLMVLPAPTLRTVVVDVITMLREDREERNL